VPRELIKAALNEVDALRRQSTLLHRGLRPRGVPLAPHGEPVDVVFLLHGFLATAGVFDPLERHLRAEGVEHVASFTYHPFRTVPSLAAELRRSCEVFPRRARLHLVGHSLGGVVARYYVQELGGAGRVEQIISLASPFHGTETARKLPSPLGKVTPVLREIAPDSPLLSRLRSRPVTVPHTSVVATEDLLVTPPRSAAFPGSEVVELDGVGHNGLLFDERAARVVSQKILARRRESQAAE
jgi:pimeloyl-ACP methyl ester carboxylesterase